MEKVIEKYIALDDEIKSLTKQVSQLKNEKLSLGGQIEQYLVEKTKENPNTVLQVGKNIFKLVSYKKTIFNKQTIEGIIKEKVSDKKIVESIISEISEEFEECRLKRTIKK
jgi:seryl-tRNA synthetase